MRLRKTVYMLAILVNVLIAISWGSMVIVLIVSGAEDGSLTGDVMVLLPPIGSVLAVVALTWKPWQV